MRFLEKGILVISLAVAFSFVSFVTLYCSVLISQQISRSNTLLYVKLSELERLSERGLIQDISIRKAQYEGGNEVVLWDFSDLIQIIKEKRVIDIYIQESQYIFPATIVPAKAWVIIGSTKYVFNFI